LATNSSWDNIFLNLLHTFFGCFKFGRRCPVGLLDETVQKDNSPFDNRAIKDSGDSLLALEPKLEKSISQCLKEKKEKGTDLFFLFAGMTKLEMSE
jgi:hypothetical protein